jgi:Flp pilus assembly protein TadD
VTDRVATLRTLLERNPANAAARFGLALEYLKTQRWADAVDELRRYLERADDEGNAYGRLGYALRRLGRDEEAKEAYRRGIEAARRHGHPGMAEEFEAILSDWEESAP